MSYLIQNETFLHLAPGGDAYRVQFYVDDNPIEPWDNDGFVPLVAYSNGRFDTDPARGFDLLNPLGHMTDSQVKAKLPEIVAALDCARDGAALDRLARDEFPDLTLHEARREYLAEILGDGWETQDRLEALATLWNLAGVPAAVHTSRGYSQGDFAALLVVAHPDAVVQFGFTRSNGKPDFRKYLATCPDDLENAAIAWGAWCWGGVIGYTVDRIDRREFERAGLELDPATISPAALNALVCCTEVDSGWGFYPDHDSDYFPLDRNHAYAIGQAIAVANADSEEMAAGRAVVMAAAVMEARPDLAPQWV